MVTTVAVPTGPTTAAATTPPLPEPESEAVDPVRNVVPRITAIAEVLNTDEDRREAIALALADTSTAIAVEDGPGTICAVVPVTAPLMAEGRWERNGEPIASSGEQRRDPPGYGDCIPNDDGEPFRDGVYQYVAVGPTGATSAAATVVVGSSSVVVWFLNSGDEPICLVHVSPEAADFYEALATDGPIQPGEAIAVEVADIDQDVRLFGCPPDSVLRTFRISPEPQTYVDMFDRPDPVATSTPATAAPTTAAASPAAPTTTTP